jgi:hypothetical protein
VNVDIRKTLNCEFTTIHDNYLISWDTRKLCGNDNSTSTIMFICRQSMLIYVRLTIYFQSILEHFRSLLYSTTVTTGVQIQEKFCHKEYTYCRRSRNGPPKGKRLSGENIEPLLHACVCQWIDQCPEALHR